MWINDERIFNSFKNPLPSDGVHGTIPTAWVQVDGRDEGQFLAYDQEGNEYVIYNPTLDELVKTKAVGDTFEILAFQTSQGLEWCVLKDGELVDGSRHITTGEYDGVPVDELVLPALLSEGEPVNGSPIITADYRRQMDSAIEAYAARVKS